MPPQKPNPLGVRSMACQGQLPGEAWLPPTMRVLGRDPQFPIQGSNKIIDAVWHNICTCTLWNVKVIFLSRGGSRIFHRGGLVIWDAESIEHAFKMLQFEN